MTHSLDASSVPGRTPRETRLADYRPPAFLVDTADLPFDASCFIEQAPRLAGPMCADQAVGEGDACLREPGTVGNVEPGAQLHRPAKLDLRIAGLPQMALCDA